MKYELIVGGNTAYYHLTIDNVYSMATNRLNEDFQLYREDGYHTKIAEGILSWDKLDDCMRWERKRYAA